MQRTLSLKLRGISPHSAYKLLPVFSCEIFSGIILESFYYLQLGFLRGLALGAIKQFFHGGKLYLVIFTSEQGNEHFVGQPKVFRSNSKTSSPDNFVCFFVYFVLFFFVIPIGLI